jgi:hypothetical protein
MLTVLLEDVKDDANDIVVDLLLDYLLQSNKAKLIEKLRERKMVPRVMDEYECDAPSAATRRLKIIQILTSWIEVTLKSLS